MTWEVIFENFPINSTFEDAQGYEMELDFSLIDSIQQMIKAGKGKAFSQGIKSVGESFGNKKIENEHFILNVKIANKNHNFLFKLEEKEKSKLVGISPEKITRDELVDVMYEILSNRVDETNLVI